jgi:hypothetical protein
MFLSRISMNDIAHLPAVDAPSVDARSPQLSDALVPAMQGLVKAVVQLDAALDRAYLEAGEPFGPTKEGRQKWLMLAAAQWNAALKAREMEPPWLSDAHFDLLVTKHWIRPALKPVPPAPN